MGDETLTQTKQTRTRSRAWVIFSFILLVCLLFIVIPPAIVLRGKFMIYRTADDAEEASVAIVFGAGVWPSGQPTDMLEDRLLTAQELYNQGKIQKILVSGDNRTSHYNEPQAMLNYLVSIGIPEDDVVLDYAGRRTYDTCYRAHEIFGVENAILVTQGYHLPRALFLCNHFGVQSAGISATKRSYVDNARYEIREILALYGSVLDVYILKPTPVLGDPLPITF